MTREGWQGFYQHLTQAKGHLTAAHGLDPRLPEAAALMITVAMGMGGERSGGDEFEWFRRAVAAQVDHQPAYDRLLTALLPRWGGSHQQMLEVGILAARTKLYETQVPYQLLRAVGHVAQDSASDAAGPWELWRKPEVYGMVSDVLTGYAEHLGPQRGGDWYRSRHAALAWRTGRIEEARKLLDLMGDRVELGVFETVDAPGDLAVSETYAFTGPHREAVASAIASQEAGRHEEALDAFRSLAGKVQADDKARRYITDRVRSLGHLVRFEAGEWVNLLPADLNALEGWGARSGKWAIEKMELPKGVGQRTVFTSTSANGGALIASDLPLGQRFEVVTRVRLPEPTVNEIRIPPWGGLVFGFDLTGRPAHRLLLEPYLTGNAHLQLEGPAGQARLQSGGPSIFKLHVTRWENRLEAAVNGQPVASPATVPPTPGRVEARVGFMLDAVAGAGKRLRVLETKVRRLEAPPAPDAMALGSDDLNWTDHVPSVVRPLGPQAEPHTGPRVRDMVLLGAAVFALAGTLVALRIKRRRYTH